MKKVGNYFMLVGLPVLGVLGVLRLGDRLLPMMCIQGPWTMEVSKPTASSSCQEQFQQAERGFSISQSGPQFSVSFNGETKAVLYGQIQDTEVSATAPEFSFATNENSSQPIQLRATIDRQSNPARLWGVFSFNNCPDLRFVATQQAGPEMRWEAR